MCKSHLRYAIMNVLRYEKSPYITCTLDVLSLHHSQNKPVPSNYNIIKKPLENSTQMLVLFFLPVDYLIFKRYKRFFFYKNKFYINLQMFLNIFDFQKNKSNSLKQGWSQPNIELSIERSRVQFPVRPSVVKVANYY